MRWMMEGEGPQGPGSQVMWSHWPSQDFLGLPWGQRFWEGEIRPMRSSADVGKPRELG